jgi:hypothetical protein
LALLAQLGGGGQEVSGVALSAGADGLGPQDLAVLADQDRRAVTDARLVEPEAVALADVTLGVEVRKQRVVDPGEAGGPGLVAELGVDGDTQNLGIGGLELRLKSVEAGNLDASGGREVQGIEDE